MSADDTRGTASAQAVGSAQWECGPHTNAWGGHDARCRQVPATSDETRETASAQPAEFEVLDWRELAPAAEWHECDCRYCDMGGDQEPVEWPLLITADGDGVDYVTDRFMAIRADLAPIPDGYEPVLPDRPNVSGLLASLAGISTEQPAPDQHFRWTVIKALELMGWDLRLLRGSDKRVAIIDQDGTPIGVTIVSSRECDDERNPDFTRPYGDLFNRSAQTPSGGDA